MPQQTLSDTDLFAEAIACHREELAGILEFDGGIPREHAEKMADTSSPAYRHECEVRWVVKLFQTEGKNAVTEYLQDAAKKRGDAPAQKLRLDALAEMKRIGSARS